MAEQNVELTADASEEIEDSQSTLTESAGEVGLENTCENCSQPTALDSWCQSCGYYPAIGTCVDLAEWEQGSGEGEFFEAEEELTPLWLGIPIWAWQLSGGLLVIVIFTLLGKFLTPLGNVTQTKWAIWQSLVGFFTFLAVHVRFAISALSHDKELGLVDVVASPLKIWIEAIADFNKTFRMIAVGIGGLTATLMAHAVLGIPYSEMISLDPAPKKKITSPLAAAAKMAGGDSGRQMTLEEAMEELAEGAGANALAAENEEDTDKAEEEGRIVHEIDCLAVGYMPTSSQPPGVRSLVIAVQTNRQWRVVGVVAVESAMQDELIPVLEALRTTKPIVECSHPAVWLKPKLRCRVEVEFAEGDSNPRSMKLLQLL